MAKTRVHVPQRISPALGVAVWVTAPPPCRVPVQPVRGHDVAVEDEVVDERHRVQLGNGIFVVRRHRHVLRRTERDEVVPIAAGAVFLPSPTPRFQEIHEVPWLIIVLLREVDVIHLLAVFVDPPILAVEVHDAALIRAFVQLQIGQVT